MQHTSWDNVPKEVLSGTIARKLIYGERVMIGQIFIAKGGVVPTHHHESEQMSYLLEGSMEFDVDGKRVVVRRGEVLVIPSNAPHSGVALEDTVSLDVFSPIRTDWLTGQDDYLRKG